MNQSKLEVITCSWRKARETMTQLVLVLLLIGWKSGANLLSQSRSVKTKRKRKTNYFFTLKWKPLYKAQIITVTFCSCRWHVFKLLNSNFKFRLSSWSSCSHINVRQQATTTATATSRANLLVHSHGQRNRFAWILSTIVHLVSWRKKETKFVAWGQQ